MGINIYIWSIHHPSMEVLCNCNCCSRCNFLSAIFFCSSFCSRCSCWCCCCCCCFLRCWRSSPRPYRPATAAIIIKYISPSQHKTTARLHQRQRLPEANVYNQHYNHCNALEQRFSATSVLFANVFKHLDLIVCTTL